MQEFFFTSSNLHQKEPSTRPPIDDIKKVSPSTSCFRPSIFHSILLFHRVFLFCACGLNRPRHSFAFPAFFVFFLASSSSISSPAVPHYLSLQGATYRSLYDTYNATDLVEYCRKHGLMVTGKKKDLIHRILHYLETGEKGAPKRKKKAPKKAKKVRRIFFFRPRLARFPFPYLERRRPIADGLSRRALPPPRRPRRRRRRRPPERRHVVFYA